MPYKPQSFAQRMGRKQYDETYKTRRYGDAVLAQAQKIRNSGRWQHVRAMALRRNPLCFDPFGFHKADKTIVPADQVHHIKPLALFLEWAYVLENLASVCFACHGKIDGLERRGLDATKYFI